MADVRLDAALCSPAMDIVISGMDGMKERLSYEDLIEPVRERMIRVIWRVVRHPEDAEDTLQEVLAIIWRKRDRIFRHPNPRALILRICVNAAVDTLRRQRRRSRSVGSATIDQLPDATAAREQGKREIEEAVSAAVGRLPSKQAVAVMMRVLEERSYKEIAEMLGCREATVRTHVLRGRIKLSRWLSYLKPSGQEEVPR